MAETSPITQVHNAIWTMLEANTGFRNLVPIGNRIKCRGGSASPEVPGHRQTDKPIVAVLPLGLRPHAEQTTSSSHLTAVWAIEEAGGGRPEGAGARRGVGCVC